MSEEERIFCDIPEEMAGRRLDQVVAELVPRYSRSRLQQWIRAGKVQVNGKILKAKEKILTPEKITGLLFDYRLHKSNNLLISEKDEYSLLSFDSIVYCEADGNYTIIHYEVLNKKHKKIATKTLKFFDEKLSPFNFLRISQSVLVNGDKVKKIVKKTNQMVMQNGESFPIAKRRKTEVIEKLGKITPYN